jgi:hypothetical protein
MARGNQVSRRHVWYRLLFCIAAPVAATACIAAVWSAFRQNAAWSALFALVMAITLAPVVLLILNLAAFPWDYSLFGRKRRTRLPSSAYYAPSVRGGIVVGHHFRSTWPGVLYLFASNGLGIRILLVGAVFVPAGQIRKISRAGWLPYVVVHHVCPEIRGPLWLFCPGLRRIPEDLPAWFTEKFIGGDVPTNKGSEPN